MPRLVTISTYRYPHEAELARAALAAEGITAYVHGADATTVLEWTVTGGVQLQVRDDEAERADAILNQLHGVQHAEEAKPSVEEPWQPPDSCEACGSPDIAQRQKLVAFTIVSAFITAIAWTQNATMFAFYIVLALAVFFIVAPSWRCRNCGHTW